MSSIRRLSVKRAIYTAALLLAGTIVQAAGLLTPSDGSLPSLEIKKHDVSVVVEDGYAVTTVEQTFYNPHAQDLEAIYSFPVPKHGAVAEFTLWIDGKPVSGEVLQKDEARKVYEEEKSAGRDVGVTEKNSFKTFDITISPVRAQQNTRIRLVYMQSATVDTGIGRYVYPLEEGGTDEQKLAFWTANEIVKEHFSFKLLLRSSYPIDALRLPNQTGAQVQQLASGDWLVDLLKSNGLAKEEGDTEGSATAAQPANGQVFSLNQDIIVYWRHQANLPGSVDLVTYKPNANKRGTYMLTVTPGDDLKPITEGRDWIFVLDISGSMSGKYATLADGVERALNKLRPEDRFRIVLFNRSARELTTGYVNATRESVLNYSRQVAGIQPSHGTDLYSGLKKGLNSLDADRTSAIVLVTDGVANVGETQQRKFIDLIRKKDTRLFTFIMGNSANRPMLEAITKASGGFAASISNSDDIVGQLLTAVSKVGHKALHGVTLRISGIKTADATPSEIGSLYRGQQLVVFGHYWGEGEAEVVLSGRISGQDKQYDTKFSFPSSSDENPEIERLWAYAAIREMQSEMEDFGEKADLKKAATDLAQEYSLVTDFTSMIVMQEDQFKARGIERHNQKRLAIEQSAQEQRLQRQVVPRRVDTKQPMYSQSRASHNSGGGAMDPWHLVFLLPLVIMTLFRRRVVKHNAG